MSQANASLHRSVYDAFNRGDRDAHMALLDDAVEYTPRAVQVDGGGTVRGRDEVLNWGESFRSVFPDWNIDPIEVRDLGRLTLATLRVSGHGGESRVPVDETIWHLAEWQEGKLLRLTSFETETEALEAAGLPAE